MKVPVTIVGCKLDLVHENRQSIVGQAISSILLRYGEIETFTECSAYIQINVCIRFSVSLSCFAASMFVSLIILYICNIWNLLLLLYLCDMTLNYGFPPCLFIFDSVKIFQ